MVTRVQRVALLMAEFTLADHLEWTGYQLPLILNYLLSFSIRATLHDVTTLALSLGLVLSNIVNDVLVALVARRRPAPYPDAGQPAREMQSILFMAAFYLVHACWWRVHLPTLVSLAGAAVWAGLALGLGGHYFASQILGGVFVGAVLGTAWSLVVHECLAPAAPRLVARWNACAPAALHLTHAFHYHPGTHCGDPHCSGYALHPTPGYTGSELGFDRLLGTLLRLILIALIHS